MKVMRAVGVGGRIMMKIGILVWGFRVVKVLRRGVVPPMLGLVQSSILVAPLEEAMRAEVWLKQAISREGMILVGCDNR